MTEVALVTRQGTHQVLVTTPDHAADALVVRHSPVADPFVPSGEALGGHRGPPLAVGKRETGGRHVEGGQIVLLDDRERTGELPVVATLEEDYPRELRDHHEGGRPLGCFLVPVVLQICTLRFHTSSPNS